MKTSVTVLLLTVLNFVASDINVISVKPMVNKRLNVTIHDVVARSSKIKCAATCRLTSWCVSANLSPDRSTCQLLSEEVSDETSLESVDGWSYLRKFILNKNNLDFRNKH